MTVPIYINARLPEARQLIAQGKLNVWPIHRHQLAKVLANDASHAYYWIDSETHMPSGRILLNRWRPYYVTNEFGVIVASARTLEGAVSETLKQARKGSR